MALVGFLTGCTTIGGYRVPPIPSTEPFSGSSLTSRLYYVDGQIRQSPCTTYEPSARACARGREFAFNEFDAAYNMAQAGDVIVLRGGRYASPIRPVTSGTAVACRSHTGEIAAISVQDGPAIQLKGVQRITISSLVLRDSLGWGRLEDSHYNVISANKFIEALARGTTGGLKLVRSHFNKIERTVSIVATTALSCRSQIPTKLGLIVEGKLLDTFIQKKIKWIDHRQIGNQGDFNAQFRSRFRKHEAGEIVSKRILLPVHEVRFWCHLE